MVELSEIANQNGILQAADLSVTERCCFLATMTGSRLNPVDIFRSREIEEFELHPFPTLFNANLREDLTFLE